MTTPTLSQLGEMTDEELNVRLAECVGYKRIVFVKDPASLWPDDIAVTTEKDGLMMPPTGDVAKRTPRYCKDANAVAEVRKGMTQEQKRSFGRRLRAIITPETEGEYDVNFAAIDASPRLQTICAIYILTP